jgi:hypothetical protein
VTTPKALCLLVALLAFLTALQAFQRPFRVYPAMEGYDDLALPQDYRNPAEMVLGRLMYSSGGGYMGARSNWTVDYPKGDRTFAALLRRLTRLDVRSVEQPVDPGDRDDIYHWPYLHVAMPGSWNLTDSQATNLREYLLRGGFLVCDSFFGTEEWAGFERGMHRIFPDRPIVELPDDDPILHTVYDLSDRYQVGNYRSLMRTGRPYRGDGSVPHWRAIYDDRGRVMVAVCFNNDLGDSWQLADEPQYPEKYSRLGIRVGVNYVVYSLTH